MGHESSARQVRVLVFAALLAPMAALPAAVARAAGAWGWLAPVLAVPFGVAGLLLFRSLGPEGLARGLGRSWGVFGRVMTALYYLWAMGIAALTMGSCVDRLSRTDYGDMSPWLLSLALGVVAWYLTAHGRAAFLRTAEIFYLVLLGVLLLLGVLGLWAVKWTNLVPGETDRAAGLGEAMLPTLATLSVGALAAFFPREEEKKGRVWGAVGWCLAGAALCLLVTGILGGTLAAELPLPLFTALQGVGVSGGFRRMEALGTAAWVLSDLTLFGMAALAGEAMTGGRRWAAWPVLAAGVLGGGLVTMERAAAWQEGILWAELAFGAVIPAALWLTRRLQARRENE